MRAIAIFQFMVLLTICGLAQAQGAPNDQAIRSVVSQMLARSVGPDVFRWCANFQRRPRLHQVAVTQRGNANQGYWPIRATVSGDCLFEDEFAPMRRPSYAGPFIPQAQPFHVALTLRLMKDDFNEWRGDLVSAGAPVLGPVRRCDSPAC